MVGGAKESSDVSRQGTSGSVGWSVVGPAHCTWKPTEPLGSRSTETDPLYVPYQSFSGLELSRVLLT